MRYIGLLRGINIGGKNRLPMKELVALCGALGWRDTRHYIQSGNLVFDADAPNALALSDMIEKHHGFAPLIMLIPAGDFENAVAHCPYEALTGKDVHVFFLAESPQIVDEAKLNEKKASSESWQLIDKCFYLHAPDGLHKSKLAQTAEKTLGVAATARNWNTVAKLREMLGN